MESGVLNKGDIQKVQGRGSSRTGLGSTPLNTKATQVQTPDSSRAGVFLISILASLRNSMRGLNK